MMRTMVTTTDEEEDDGDDDEARMKRYESRRLKSINY